MKHKIVHLTFHYGVVSSDMCCFYFYCPDSCIVSILLPRHTARADCICYKAVTARHKAGHSRTGVIQTDPPNQNKRILL